LLPRAIIPVIAPWIAIARLVSYLIARIIAQHSAERVQLAERFLQK
jgi:hypothetical protein